MFCAMIMRIVIVFVLLAAGIGLAGCDAKRTQVWLWPPAMDVNDP